MLDSFTHAALERPTGIAAGPSGAIFVADYLTDRVVLFSAEGRKLGELRGGIGKPFHGPVGLTTDEIENLYVVEFDAHRVQQFDRQRKFLRAWGGDGPAPGQFHFPVGVAAGADGFLYVADTHNRRIQKFTRGGEFVAEWGRPGRAANQLDDVTGVAVAERWLVVADSGLRRLQLWTLDGRHLHTLDLSRWVGEGIESPTAVAVDASGQVFVLDPAGPRVLRFQLHPETLD